MTGNVIQLEQRRAPRKHAASSPLVVDTIGARPLGYLCNVSASGVLLLASEPPRREAVFQIRLPLAGGADAAAIEIGLQEQWQQPASSPGQVWVGYRIISIAPEDTMVLARWLQRA